MKQSERAHAAAPPFQIEPTSLGFDLALTGPLIDGIYTVEITPKRQHPAGVLPFLVLFGRGDPSPMRKMQPVWY